VIDGDACATAVAHEALDILFEVLGYRGEEALVLHIEAEEADEWDGVSGDFEPGRLALLLRQDGYHLRTAVGEPSAADRHLVVDVSDDIRITVSAAPDGQRYSVSTPLKDLIRGRDALARTYPNGCVRVACDANGIALLSSDVTLAPGETEERSAASSGPSRCRHCRCASNPETTASDEATASAADARTGYAGSGRSDGKGLRSPSGLARAPRSLRSPSRRSGRSDPPICFQTTSEK